MDQSQHHGEGISHASQRSVPGASVLAADDLQSDQLKNRKEIAAGSISSSSSALKRVTRQKLERARNVTEEEDNGQEDNVLVESTANRVQQEKVGKSDREEKNGRENCVSVNSASMREQGDMKMRSEEKDQHHASVNSASRRTHEKERMGSKEVKNGSENHMSTSSVSVKAQTEARKVSEEKDQQNHTSVKSALRGVPEHLQMMSEEKNQPQVSVRSAARKVQEKVGKASGEDRKDKKSTSVHSAYRNVQEKVRNVREEEVKSEQDVPEVSKSWRIQKFRTVPEKVRQVCEEEEKDQCSSSAKAASRRRQETASKASEEDRDQPHTSVSSTSSLESVHVQRVYDHIAPYIEDLRQRTWPRVKDFLKSLRTGSLVADIGCGNGRYLHINPSVFKVGSDICQPFLHTAASRGFEVLSADNLQLPFRDAVFDAVISVGVVHHFATRERRIQALQELVRILQPGGLAMVYVWAFEQKFRKFDSQDILVPWRKPRQSDSGSKRPCTSSQSDTDRLSTSSASCSVSDEEFTPSQLPQSHLNSELNPSNTGQYVCGKCSISCKCGSSSSGKCGSSISCNCGSSSSGKCGSSSHTCNGNSHTNQKTDFSARPCVDDQSQELDFVCGSSVDEEERGSSLSLFGLKEGRVWRGEALIRECQKVETYLSSLCKSPWEFLRDGPPRLTSSLLGQIGSLGSYEDSARTSTTTKSSPSWESLSLQDDEVFVMDKPESSDLVASRKLESSYMEKSQSQYFDTSRKREFTSLDNPESPELNASRKLGSVSMEDSKTLDLDSSRNMGFVSLEKSAYPDTSRMPGSPSLEKLEFGDYKDSTPMEKSESPGLDISRQLESASTKKPESRDLDSARKLDHVQREIPESSDLAASRNMESSSMEKAESQHPDSFRKYVPTKPAKGIPQTVVYSVVNHTSAHRVSSIFCKATGPEDQNRRRKFPLSHADTKGAAFGKPERKVQISGQCPSELNLVGLEAQVTPVAGVLAGNIHEVSPPRGILNMLKQGLNNIFSKIEKENGRKVSSACFVPCFAARFPHEQFQIREFPQSSLPPNAALVTNIPCTNTSSCSAQSTGFGGPVSFKENTKKAFHSQCQISSQNCFTYHMKNSCDSHSSTAASSPGGTHASRKKSYSQSPLLDPKQHTTSTIKKVSCKGKVMPLTRRSRSLKSTKPLPKMEAADTDLCRFYHVFREGELEELIREHVPGVEMLDSFYDHSNWCIILLKL